MIQAIERLQAVKLRDPEVLQLVLRANRRTLSGNPE
jgi:hypothetical protein